MSTAWTGGNQLPGEVVLALDPDRAGPAGLRHLGLHLVGDGPHLAGVGRRGDHEVAAQREHRADLEHHDVLS